MNLKDKVVGFTQFDDLKLYKRGKVRDIYDLGDNLLIISTDRISCFDVVLPDCIPNKGRVLTQMSLFWFKFTKDIINNHLITSNTDSFPLLIKYKDILKDRSMIVKKATPIPVECVVRGYLSGSGWKEYQKDQSICSIKLPSGSRESDKLADPIFTPATKEDTGHDINVTQKYIENFIGKETALRLKDLSIKIYKEASQYTEKRGIIIADTKFEFGLYEGELILIDEVLTPDSSRFWPRDKYKPGRSQPSFDKQYVRDYLETLDWNKTPPAPELPEDIIKETSKKYLTILDLLIREDIYDADKFINHMTEKYDV